MLTFVRHNFKEIRYSIGHFWVVFACVKTTSLCETLVMKLCFICKLIFVHIKLKLLHETQLRADTKATYDHVWLYNILKIISINWYLHLCEGFKTNIFRNMKADLVTSLSFSPCIARISIEKPSLFKNASSASGKSLVRPAINSMWFISGV